MMLVVPADPLRPRRPEPHFAPEAAAARAAGWAVAVVDHDALVRPGGAAATVRRMLDGAGRSGPVVYRGWMLRAERYAEFATALAGHGVTPLTSPQHYRRAHELPGWYDALATVTAESGWTVGVDRRRFTRLCAELGTGPAVLRDYTKSMKHHWHEAAYVPEVADHDAAWRVARRFLELRAEDLVGGLVLRRFERFRSAEVRTWWIGGRLALVGPHPDTTDADPSGDVELSEVAPLVATLDLPFVTVDLALRDDGRWRVVELGDGQVSDRPATMPPETLITALAEATSQEPPAMCTVGS